MISEPTRHRSGQQSNILDLIICNDENYINEICHLPPIGCSDHDVFKVSMDVLNNETVSNNMHFYDYFKGDYEQCREELNLIHWDDITDMEIEDAWEFLKCKIKDVEAKFVPLKTAKKVKNKPPWLSKRIQSSINKKRRLYKCFLNKKSSRSYDTYIQSRNLTKSMIRTAVRCFERKIAHESKSNVKCFWKYVNNKLKRKTGIGPICRPDKSKTNNDREKADIFNTYFSSVFVNENIENVPVFEKRYDGLVMSDIEIDEADVNTLLKGLDDAKSMGPDGLHPRLLKEVADVISYPVSIVFNKSISTGILPKDWKHANVTAVFKKR